MDSVIRAVFIKELKNRFRCLVSIDGDEVVCYVPSSCRLDNFIELDGRSVLLRKTGNSETYKYSLFALETKKGLVLLNLSLANKVVAGEINRRLFSFLGKRKKVFRETSVEGYKCDLFIQDSKTVIEIKTVLTLDRDAHFPSVSSQRSKEQLKNILTLLEKGYKVCYMFVALSPYTKSIAIDADEQFTYLFKNCVKRGMLVYACSLKIMEDDVRVNRQINVII